MPERIATESGKEFTVLAYLEDLGGPNFLIRHADGKMELVSPSDGYGEGSPLAVPEDHDLLLSQHGYLPCAESGTFSSTEELKIWAATKSYQKKV